LCEEAIGNSALIEHLYRAGMQTAGMRTGQVLVRSSLHDGHVNVRKSQLAR
jgi:hypothetical protein